MASSTSFQVECSYSSTYGENRVTGLILESMQLHGIFPSGTLGNLSALSHLSVYDNDLAGPFPAEIFSLLKLSYLSLSRNLFSGAIPVGFSHLVHLSRLDLSHNRLSGALPDDFRVLAELRFLYLSSNAFSQDFPAFLLSLPNLVDLNISYNNLQGSLPSSFNTAMAASSLSTLDLSHNNLTGPIPSFNQVSSHLQCLDLSHNTFKGDVSGMVSSLPGSLTWLDLSSNMLTGQPSWNVSHTPSLNHLAIAANPFTPSPLQWITAFHKLQYLNLSQMHIVGIIPNTIAFLTNLVVLDLSYNNLYGSLPSSFTSLQNITYLDLSSNNLSGEASVLLKLKALSSLNYSFNDPSDCDIANEIRDKFGQDSFIGLCKSFAADKIQNSGKHRSKHTAIMIGSIAICLAVFVCCVLARGLFALRRRRKMHRAIFIAKKFTLEEQHVSGPFSFKTESGTWMVNVKNSSSVPVVVFEKPLLELTFADLLQATASFSKEAQLAEGGFGPVYKAALPGGLEVTIKVLIEGRIRTDQEAEEEFAVLSKVKHPNIVPLLGYCLVGEERLVMYQYMENNVGLDRWLHDLPIGMQLDDWRDFEWEPTESEVPISGELGLWSRRRKIALGIARALSFLHHGHSPHIIHRDVKASNILLDKEFEPQLADTGLVGLLAAGDESSFAGSTTGYAPPEYHYTGSKVSTKGDVYSYGVVLLELVTGKRPFGDYYQEGFSGNLVAWVRFLTKEKRMRRALDPRISLDRAAVSEMLEALHIGSLCTAEVAAKRPSMQQVVGLLKDL